VRSGRSDPSFSPPIGASSLERLRDRFEREGACVAGVLSGTSGDGINVVLARMSVRDGRVAQPALIASQTHAFPAPLALRVRAVLDGEPASLRTFALLHRDLGRAFGRAARDAARERNVDLDLVGSHGQTVWHHDGDEADGAATLQAGDGDFVCAAAGCIVASDFRQSDIAAGGEGAPVSALADDVIFADARRPCAILNLGGIGNLTLLGAEPDEVLAFDTGPANSLLDGIARHLLQRPFDAGGEHALRGRADERFVRELGEHPFLAKPPPRSTGRDTFGEPWVRGVIDRARSLGMIDRPDGVDDLLASAVEFVAACVAHSLSDHGPSRTNELIVAGGGARNRALIAAIERRTGARATPSDELGVPIEAREGLVFAVLAARCALGLPSTHPGATGAARGRVLGKISQPAVPTARSPGSPAAT
jgi:anhydro-N-acetylmuramic acid kinase